MFLFEIQYKSVLLNYKCDISYGTENAINIFLSKYLRNRHNKGMFSINRRSINRYTLNTNADVIKQHVIKQHVQFVHVLCVM